MRWSRSKNESQGGIVGGSEVKSIFVHIDDMKHNLRYLSVLSYREVVNKSILTVKNELHVFVFQKTMILYIIRGVEGILFSPPISRYPSYENQI